MPLGEEAARWLAAPRAEVFATGIARIDSFTSGGLRAGDLTIVGAATGMGKSAFAEQLALEIGRKHDVLFLPLEMGERDTTDRMAAKLERLSLQSYRDQGMSEFTREDLNRRRILVHEPPEAIDVAELCRLIADGGSPVVIVDHAREILGWLPEGKVAAAHVGPSTIVREIRRCARAVGVHVILCAQLNRGGYKTRPGLSALQDTSSLEQQAALVLLLHRPFVDDAAADNVAEIVVAKNRYGPRGLVHMRWAGTTMKLFPMSAEEEADAPCCAQEKAPDSYRGQRG